MPSVRRIEPLDAMSMTELVGFTPSAAVDGISIPGVRRSEPYEAYRTRLLEWLDQHAKNGCSVFAHSIYFGDHQEAIHCLMVWG